MNIAVEPEAIDEMEPLWRSVSRLGAGFRRMEALASELVTLDAVSSDVWQTHSNIRRDIANVVLQTAFALKESQDKVTELTPETKTVDPVGVTPEMATRDVWAKRLVRWADRFGRDLFGHSTARDRAEKKGSAALPRQES